MMTKQRDAADILRSIEGQRDAVFFGVAIAYELLAQLKLGRVQVEAHADALTAFNAAANLLEIAAKNLRAEAAEAVRSPGPPIKPEPKPEPPEPRPNEADPRMH